MASSPESYAVELEFAESHQDPFEAILDLRARVAELENAIRGLVVDGYDNDGPYTKNCAACLACDIPYSFKHCEGCPAKPALDLVFGPKDAGHCRYEVTVVGSSEIRTVHVMVDVGSGDVGEGHTPGESDWKPLTAQQVNLLQHENGQLKARVVELLGETVRVDILARVTPHDGEALRVTAALEDKERLWKFIAACPHIVQAYEYVLDKGGEAGS